VVKARVMLVDDELEFKAIARQVLGGERGVQIVGEASSGEEALAMASELRPELAIVDVHMGGMDGFATARALLERLPGLRVVIVSSQEETDYGSISLSVGAAGFISKKRLSLGALEALVGSG
jgi:DNA-binding NarL/FixJ family response regulator